MTAPELTILFDNYADPEPRRLGLRSLWGFAALLELPGYRLLFDTGSNGRVLVQNMRTLGLDPATIDGVFLSHAHWDHMGGLDSILELNPGATVFLHAGFSRHLIADLKTLCAEVVVVGTEPQAIGPGLWSTGMLSAEPPEQALVLELAGGDLAVISGCAHPGMEQIAAGVLAGFGRPLRWAIGGFHLMDADDATIAQRVAALRRLDIPFVVPTHCTGDAARLVLRRIWGSGFVEGGVGRQVPLDRPRAV